MQIFKSYSTKFLLLAFMLIKYHCKGSPGMTLNITNGYYIMTRGLAEMSRLYIGLNVTDNPKSENYLHDMNSCLSIRIN